MPTYVSSKTNSLLNLIYKIEEPCIKLDVSKQKG